MVPRKPLGQGQGASIEDTDDFQLQQNQGSDFPGVLCLDSLSFSVQQSLTWMVEESLHTVRGGEQCLFSHVDVDRVCRVQLGRERCFKTAFLQRRSQSGFGRRNAWVSPGSPRSELNPGLRKEIRTQNEQAGAGLPSCSRFVTAAVRTTPTKSNFMGEGSLFGLHFQVIVHH